MSTSPTKGRESPVSPLPSNSGFDDTASEPRQTMATGHTRHESLEKFTRRDSSATESGGESWRGGRDRSNSNLNEDGTPKKNSYVYFPVP